MKFLPAALALLAVGTASFADDKPADTVKPAEPVKPATPAKKERTVAPEAKAALDKFAEKLAFPVPGTRAIKASADSDMPQVGNVTLDFSWTEGEGVALEAHLPDSALQQIPPEQVGMWQEQIRSQFAQFFEQAFVSRKREFEQYSLAVRTDGGKKVVDFTRFDDKARWDRKTAYFDADGLVEKEVGQLNLDPDDPQTAMLAGADIELSYKYARRGDLLALESATVLTPMGEIGSKFSYYDLKDGVSLPSRIEVTVAFLSPDPFVVNLHDYELNGKPVEGTALPKKADAPKEGAKPAEPPKTPQPTPTDKL
jgi:hypothetical protein